MQLYVYLVSACQSELFHKLSDLRLGKAREDVLSIPNLPPYPTFPNLSTNH